MTIAVTRTARTQTARTLLLALLTLTPVATGCVATARTTDLRVEAPAVASRSARDVNVDVSITSDERFGELKPEQERAWRDRILGGVRDAGLFRSVAAGPRSASEKNENWLAQVSLRRDRTSPGGLGVACLLTGFIVPGYKQTNLVFSVVLTDPTTEQKLRSVVVRGGFGTYFSWFALPFFFFTPSEEEQEDQLAYELTRVALDEATKQGIVNLE